LLAFSDSGDFEDYEEEVVGKIKAIVPEKKINESATSNQAAALGTTKKGDSPKRQTNEEG